jgi:adenylylsulfate kinase-like enzyme
VIAARIAHTGREGTRVEIVGSARFLEVYCNAPLEICEVRDMGRTFARARRDIRFARIEAERGADSSRSRGQKGVSRWIWVQARSWTCF